MVNLHMQLRDAGHDLSDQAFHGCFTKSLPLSLDLFIMLYEDNMYDVDLLCGKFAKYEMHQKLRASKSRKGEGSLDGNVTLFGQQSAEKKRKEEVGSLRHHMLWLWEEGPHSVALPREEG